MTHVEHLEATGWERTTIVPTVQYANRTKRHVVSWDGHTAEIWGGLEPSAGEDIGILPSGGKMLGIVDVDGYGDLLALLDSL
jgi:hypothetical protein